MNVIIFIFITLIGLSYGTHEKVCSTPPGAVTNFDTHYIAIIDSLSGSFLKLTHDYLFEQLYCGLTEYKQAKVPFDVWHIRPQDDACEIFNTPDASDNIHGNEKFASAAVRSTICQKLEAAKKCASKAWLKSTKIEIAIPMLLHDELGDCDLDQVFPFRDYKLTIFQTAHYFDSGEGDRWRKAEFVFFGVSTEFLPRRNWKPTPLMVEALKKGKSEITHAMGQRFSRLLKMRGFGMQNDVTTNASIIGVQAPRSLPAANLTVDMEETSTFSLVTNLPSTNKPTSAIVDLSNQSSPSKPLTAKLNFSAASDMEFSKPTVKSITKTTTTEHSSSTSTVIPKGGHVLDYFDALPLEEAVEYADARVNMQKPADKRKEELEKMKDDKKIQTSFHTSTTTSKPSVAFAAVGEIFGDPDNGLFWFLFILGLSFIGLFLVLICCCCICRGSRKRGKYEVVQEQAGITSSSHEGRRPRRSMNQMDVSPLPELGIEPHIIQTPKNSSFEPVSLPRSTPALHLDYPMTTPSEPHFSSMAITPLSSQRGPPTRSVRFQLPRDDTQTIRSLRVAQSDEEISYIPTER